MAQNVVVAIDGPAGAGKSTIARSVADRLGFLYIDTGAMYRAVALWAIRANISDSDMHKLEHLAREAEITFEPGTRRVLLNGEDVTEAIRTPQVSAAASKVSAVPAVRRALVEKQREMGTRANVVMEGRDIGSIVFPDAKVKIFLDAETQVRAGRRTNELRDRGHTAAVSATLLDIEERDLRDRSRAESPLVQAPDAVYLDSSNLSIKEVEEAILKLIRERTTNGKEYPH
jgi:cytidylate kinase